MARSFNGSSNFAINSGMSFSPIPCTLACLFRVSSIAPHQTIFGVGNGTSEYYELQVRGTTIPDGGVLGAVKRTAGPVFSIARTAVTIPTNTWVLGVARLASNSDNRVYMYNSGTTGSDSTSFAIGSQNTAVVGRAAYSSSTFLGGQVTKACIWNVALSASEIDELGGFFHPSMVRPESIVALWDFDQGASPEPDHWGGYSLTLTGTTQVDDPPIIYPSDWIDAVQYVAPPADTGNRRRRLLICGAA